MKRFFIDPAEITKDFPVIEGPEAHHIISVFRLKPKDHIILVDGSEAEYQAEITDVSKNRVTVSIIKRYHPATESVLRIHIGQGYLKDRKMDMLVRHLTEIGITSWLPVVSEFSVPKPDKKKMNSKIQRWELIAKEAVKQSRRTVVPKIHFPLSFPEAVTANVQMDLKIIFYENETAPLSRIPAILNEKPLIAFALLGPEGGFSNKEVAFAKSNGFMPISLGPRILRAETASISACALIQHLFGDMH